MSKMTTEQFWDHRRRWRSEGLTEGSIWQHYKGGVYVIDGFGIDTHHGGFLVRYHRVDGPNFDARAEDGIQFFRAPEEWKERTGAGGHQLRFEQLAS